MRRLDSHIPSRLDEAFYLLTMRISRGDRPLGLRATKISGLPAAKSRLAETIKKPRCPRGSAYRLLDSFCQRDKRQALSAYL
jgi:siroheme synthase (precorrin-2 oxidase/ferrochelatase)